MLKKLLLLCMALLVVAPAALSADQPSSSLSMDQIVEKNAAARGGLAAWRAVQTMRMTGDMDAGHGVKLPYTLDLKRKRKMRLELKFEGKTAVQVYDGKQGWKFRPYLGKTVAETMSPQELQHAAGQTDLDGALMDYSTKGYKLELMGREAVEGKDAYKLKITMPGNVVRHLWVDSASFLEVKIDGTRKMDGKEHAMYTYIRDYKTESGLLIPHLLETETEGVKGTQKLTVQAVVLNPAIDDSRFTKP
jgi:outer membrane lipoprotein-sorting protein